MSLLAQTLEARTVARIALWRRHVALHETAEQRAARMIAEAITGYSLWLAYAPIDERGEVTL